MGYRQYQPDNEFELDLRVKVKVTDMLDWDGFYNQEGFTKKCKSLIESGELSRTLKILLVEHLQNEVLDVSMINEGDVVLDRIVFEIEGVN